MKELHRINAFQIFIVGGDLVHTRSIPDLKFSVFTKLHQTLLQVHLFYGRWGVGARSQHDPAACKKSILHRADKY